MGSAHLMVLDNPRKIESIHQIEMTSHCNLRCKYCPSPTLGREKVHMSDEHYIAALAWAREFYKKGTQNEINLAGIGESTMHPNFPRLARLARDFLGDKIKIVLATNGLITTDSVISAIDDSNIKVWVSLHRPEKAGIAVAKYREIGALVGISADPSVNPNDWAGQVEWIRPSKYTMPCPWLRKGQAVIFADGRVSTCCIDSTGAGVIGHVLERSHIDGLRPYSLCKTCYQEIGASNWDQENGVSK